MSYYICRMQKLLFVFSFILLMLNCTSNNQTETYTKPPQEKLDSLCEWLTTHDQNLDSNYNKVYLNAYENLIRLKHYDSATRILCIKGISLEQTFVPDTQYIQLAFQHEQLYKSEISNRFLSSLYLRLGMQLSYQNKWDSSYLILQKTYLPKTDYYTAVNIAYADLFICNYFFRNGSTDTALKFGLNSRDGFQKTGDTNLEVKALNQLYYVYVFGEDYDDAKKTLNQADSLARLIKDSVSIFNTYYDKLHYVTVTHSELSPAYIHLLTQETESMYSFYKKWYPQGSRYVDKHVQANIVYANMFIERNELTIAKQYLDSAKFYLTKMNPPSSFRLEDYNYTFDLYQMKAGVVDIKLEKYDVLLKDLEDQEQYFLLQELYDLYYANALRKADYALALQYKIKYEAMSDSLSNFTLRSKVKEYDKKYQTTKKEKTIVEQNSEIQKSKFQITALLFALTGIILATFIFLGYKKRKEAQAEIIRQQQFTDELLQNTEDERKRIATDLHDGVNHELLTLKNQVNSGNLITGNDIENVIDEVRQVSRDLYPAMFDNIGLQASIEALCERLTEAGLFTTSEINYTIKLPKRSELQLYRIIQEALNNTLKHARANAAKVTIETKDDELWVEIKDNGIGFDATQKMNDTSSFGLQSFLQRARAIGGKSNIESDANGTKLILTTPLH